VTTFPPTVKAGPYAIPGRLDFVNYDMGGEQIAFHAGDHITTKAGAGYRKELDAQQYQVLRDGPHDIGEARLAALAVRLGADVPFFLPPPGPVRGGAHRARGRPRRSGLDRGDSAARGVDGVGRFAPRRVGGGSDERRRVGRLAAGAAPSPGCS
jgi:hypothetical protein